MGGTLISKRVLLSGLALLIVASAAYFLGRTTTGAALSPPIGATCEVVLKSDAVGAGMDWPTPRNTRDSIGGSRTSVVGTISAITDDWLAVGVVPLRVAPGGTPVTTGPANQVFIPRASIAFIRMFPTAPPPAPIRPILSSWSVLLALIILIAGLWLVVWLRSVRKASSRGFEVIATPPTPHPVQPRPMPVE
jgi:hypothetical protein